MIGKAKSMVGVVTTRSPKTLLIIVCHISRTIVIGISLSNIVASFTHVESHIHYIGITYGHRHFKDHFIVIVITMN